MDSELWGPLSREDATWQIGRSRIWTRQREDEWEIASVSLPSDEVPGPEPTSDLTWTRIVTTPDDPVAAQPALPDRPVVVRPDRPMVILPGRWGRFFFRVPLWTRFVSLASGREATMEEIPSRSLASIWFGTIAGGELCYAIEAPLERTVEDLEIDHSFAICEVTVRNSSRERLRFERICVHVEYMSLFGSGDRLWTNEVRVAFRGAEQVSQLTFLPGPPSSVKDAWEVSPSRVPPESDLIKRSFALIREITGI